MFDYKHYNSLDEMLTDEEYMLKKRVMLLTRIVVNESGCWNYTRYCDPEGRAKTQIGYKSIATARLSYIVFKQEPIGDKFVCHSCDNPSCINPEHLWLGTHQDNMIDRDAKGRCQRPIGTKNNKCKLTEADVAQIKADLAQGISGSEISRKFNVTPSAVSYIKLGKSWKHV
jgi:hypothetical protein